MSWKQISFQDIEDWFKRLIISIQLIWTKDEAERRNLILASALYSKEGRAMLARNTFGGEFEISWVESRIPYTSFCRKRDLFLKSIWGRKGRIRVVKT